MTYLAVAGYQNLTRANRTIGQTNGLVAALQLARSEAVKRNTNVFVCASQTAGSANPKCDTTTWESGWIVFADPNRDDLTATNAYSGSVPNADDTILNLGQGLNGGTTIQSPNKYVYYSSSGRINNNAAVSFILCDSTKDVKQAHAINIGSTGLVSIAEDTDTTKDYIVNLANGSNVTCP